MRKKISDTLEKEDLTRSYSFTLIDNRTSNITKVDNASLSYVINVLKHLDKVIIENYKTGTKMLGGNVNTKTISKDNIDNR